MKAENLTLACSLLAWGALYYLLGWLSLVLDGPDIRTAFIWLPSGVAVTAFLLTAKKQWLALGLVLFIARLGLGLTFHHTFHVSLVLGVFSLASHLGIAWSVRHFSRGYDRLHKIVNWTIATVVFSTLSALAGVVWLSYLAGTLQMAWFWLAWSANVTGTLFVTPPLMGLLARGEKAARPESLAGVCLVFAILLATLFIFSDVPDRDDNIALIYSLACLPLILLTATTAVCGDRLASLAFILFSAVVIYASWRETGPFYFARLTPEESVLLAQCYLSAAALLLVFIRAQKTHRDSEGHSRGVAYSLDPETGRLMWDPHADPAFAGALASIATREALLSRLPEPHQQAQMAARWQAVAQGQPVAERFRFTLALAGHTPVTITERNMLLMADRDRPVIVAFWSEDKGSLFQPAPQEES
ncbi:MASE1 domain-containing protein [Leclercia adecarboxylata]|uniref:MASE1 domain-containing protein n=1 Tax=Leclercia adecarboxylata TaxID=83655 RepID=UPI002DBFF729|nr:MASE1 domain-containing protein [Leclercia adecarboxylata]MEB6377751.1 MASE1 domain-containing protein [Leclercia adecarboxylata]